MAVVCRDGSIRSQLDCEFVQAEGNVARGGAGTSVGLGSTGIDDKMSDLSGKVCDV